MNKLTKVLIGAVVLAAVFCQLIIPGLVGKTISTKVKEATEAKNVTTHVSALPGFMLLTGQMDEVTIEADDARLGEVQLAKLTLQGKNLKADFSALDTKDGSVIKYADELQVTGVITQQALQDLLERKLEKVENIKTTMDKEKVQATGQLKILGRKAEVSIQGVVFAKKGSIYFHMTRLDIRNSLLGKAGINNFFGDIQLFTLHNMSERLDVDDVEMRDGSVVIKASRH